jgi:glutaminyl-tRNA synthetase
MRDDLNKHAPRAMAVLEPLRVVIENYPEDWEEFFEVPNYPQDKSNDQTRQIPFSRVIYIEQDDFMEDPPGKYFRLAPGREVRLLGAYYITCREVVKDESGRVVELRCTYDPESRGGSTPDGRKVKGTIHWVSAAYAVPAEVRLYDTLFLKADPTEGDDDFIDHLNPDSLVVLNDCRLEPSLAQATADDRFQFMRQGYFCLDPVDSRPEQLVFNRTVTLRDTWAKIQKQKP